MVFRRAEEADSEEIMQIIRQAQKYFKEEGINQWQNGYPNQTTIQEDIKNQKTYVLIKEDKLLAAAALSFNDENTYNTIYEGEWLNNGSYGVVHRIAVNKDYKGTGLAIQLFAFIEPVCQAKGVKSIKVDTHEDNKSMQRLLEKLDFKYCGIIYLTDGNKRVAFEKRLRA